MYIFIFIGNAIANVQYLTDRILRAILENIICIYLYAYMHFVLYIYTYTYIYID